MNEDLEDLIERAKGLSKNGGLQITVRSLPKPNVTVHFINPTSQRLEKVKAPTVRMALEQAIDDMMLTASTLKVVE